MFHEQYTKEQVQVRVDPERQISACAIFSVDFYNEFATIENTLMVGDLIQSKTVKRLLQWCFIYYHSHQSVPGVKGIRDLLAQRAEVGKDDDVEIVSSLVESILDSYDEHENWLRIIQQVFEYVKKRQFEIHASRIRLLVDAGEIEEAENEVVNFSTVKREATAGLSIFDVKNVVRVINEGEGESVFTLPGAIGQLLGSAVRGDLFAFVAPAKRGKSWWLQEVAIKAMTAGNVVVFYSLEMSEKQMLVRIMQRLTGSLRSNSKAFEKDVPYFDEDGDIKFEQTILKPYTSKQVVKKINSVGMIAGRGDIHLCCFPAGTISVQDLRSHLLQLSREKGIVPDMVVVDYADILMPGIKQDIRHQIDHTWKMLRSLAQEFNILVVTASHSNRSTFNKDMTQEDLSEDIRKLNHVSCMIGLNQKSVDKKIGVMRAVSLAQRHDAFNTDDEVVVLMDLNTGRPILDSEWKSNTNYKLLVKGEGGSDE